MGDIDIVMKTVFQGKMIQKIDLDAFDKLSTKEMRKVLGLGEPIPRSSWRKEVRNLSAVELIKLHRHELKS